VIDQDGAGRLLRLGTLSESELDDFLAHQSTCALKTYCWTKCCHLRQTCGHEEAKALRRKPTSESDGAALLVLHGPNLNLLGTREPKHYGSTTLAEINLALAQARRSRGCQPGVLPEQSRGSADRACARGRPAGRPLPDHQSSGLHPHQRRAARRPCRHRHPFVEVHLSNVHAREAFRHHSYFSDLAIGVITGLGSEGYLLALEYLLSKISAE
jgi:3-dehydroquinate dehydratase-2